MSNVAFAELPKGFTEGDTMIPVSYLVISGISALKVHVIELTMWKGKKSGDKLLRK